MTHFLFCLGAVLCAARFLQAPDDNERAARISSTRSIDAPSPGTGDDLLLSPEAPSQDPLDKQRCAAQRRCLPMMHMAIDALPLRGFSASSLPHGSNTCAHVLLSQSWT